MDFLLLSGPSPSRRTYDYNGRRRAHRESCSFEHHPLLDFFIGTLFLVPLCPALTLQIPHSSRVASRVYLLLDSPRRDSLAHGEQLQLTVIWNAPSPCTVIPSMTLKFCRWRWHKGCYYRPECITDSWSTFVVSSVPLLLVISYLVLPGYPRQKTSHHCGGYLLNALAMKKLFWNKHRPGLAL